MISLRSFAPWSDNLSKEVHPRFVYGRQGWLLMVSLLLIVLGVRHGMETYEVFQPLAQGILPGYRGLIVSILAVEIAITVVFIIPGALLLLKRPYSVAGTHISIVCLPIVLFVGRTFVEPYDEGIWAGIATYFLPAAVLLSLPILLYLRLSARVRNTFMFTGPSLPSSIACPFCLTKQAPTLDERKKKLLICCKCGKVISEETVAA